MSDVPAKIDPTVFADRLRDRIRSTLGDLIPEEQWNALMRAEVDRFFNEKREGSGYHERRYPSDFAAIVQEAIGQHVRERVKAYLDNDPEWKKKWDGHDFTGIPAKLEEMIEKNLPVLLRECVGLFFTGFAAHAAMNANMQIDQRLRERL